MFKLFLNTFTFSVCLALPALAGDFVLKSKDIAEGNKLSNAHVFRGFGCQGDNISPQLSWQNAPKGTKSFVVTVYDPDAPTGSGWWHWIVFNIPGDVNQLATNASASGKMPIGSVQARNDFGTNRFGGACPPSGGMHRYIFTVYALDVPKLDVDESASPAIIGFMTRTHALASTKITAVYYR